MRDRLYRSRSDRMLFGVAGGMADYLGLDPSLVRIVWALLVLAGGIGGLLYIIAAIVIPEEPSGATSGAAPADTAGGATTSSGATSNADWEARRAARRAARAQSSGTGAMIFGLVLVAVGAWFLVSRFLKIDSDVLLPVVLIALGAVLVFVALARTGRGRA